MIAVLKNLPTLNATLNFLSGVFLFLGWLAIKKNDRKLHQKHMITAFIVSMLFLVSYLTYHFLFPGVTHYHRAGILKIIYLTILITHSFLAMFIPFLAVIAIVLAYKQKFTAHKRITQFLWPSWMYVSVTGVIVYLMLYHF